MKPEFDIEHTIEPEIDDEFFIPPVVYKKSKKKKAELERDIASYIG
ncbi:MAG: hypothetical protein OH319_01955 [Candidatus Parvarchaeota archaeon]|nr:hypothetical protein [Candidatus Jingweiarchaeum tengchongense]MCW1298135.1 hypothetical protein [Candidatus Jingweiarchaeum tengchongense]MCW1299934.1 hypothetical protein [Candidatus Jingweiarchaeum tengchongense]MCW1305081.1 hypothetical protein [Candidatus Jingweiarchaeum tengchongense]MCW1305556.1 hypothetical protein [Candidatus Jingweiarchaeum tengchongense]